MDNRGETASPGDAAQLALWLATRHGFTEYLDDVERIVRARILPSQVTETPPLHVATPGARKDADPSRRLESRRSTPPLHVAIPGVRKDANPGRRLESRRSTPPLHVAILGARKDAGPSRRLESRRSTPSLHPPGSVVPKQWPADGGAVRGRATTRVAPASRSTAATRWAPLMDNPRAVSRGIRRGDFPVPRHFLL